MAFLKYLFVEKMRTPLTPLYWFLISKGYKTYLLMANNFPTHWPRHEKPTPAFAQAVIDGFARQKYRDFYDAERGLIVYPSSHGQLKAGVANIDADLLRENRRVAFFQERNPTWQQGDELCCLAEMTFWMPFQYLLKTLTKRRIRMARARGTEPGPASRPERPDTPQRITS